jgi:hypothetical protein
MTRIGKKRRKVSANPSELFHSHENCMAVSIGISLEFSPVLRGQIPQLHSPQEPP